MVDNVSFARVWTARYQYRPYEYPRRFFRARVDGSSVIEVPIMPTAFLSRACGRLISSIIPTPGRSYLGADQIKHEREEHNPDKHDRQQRNKNAK